MFSYEKILYLAHKCLNLHSKILIYSFIYLVILYLPTSTINDCMTNENLETITNNVSISYSVSTNNDLNLYSQQLGQIREAHASLQARVELLSSEVSSLTMTTNNQQVQNQLLIQENSNLQQELAAMRRLNHALIAENENLIEQVADLSYQNSLLRYRSHT